ncbi:MAG TPA: hypothetical protein VJK73_00325 [Candidatus Paceibacterota bacterium]
MLIVLAIIGIITIIVITSQGAFNKSLLLGNAAYDLALAIRSTESYGLGSRVSTALASNTGYGLSFTAGPSVSTFTLFADSYPGVVAANCHGRPVTGVTSPDAKVGDCVYTALARQDQLITTYTLNNGITISKICAFSGTWTCTPTLSRLDIVFARPDPTPFMSVNGAYSAANSRACIMLVSPQGGQRFIAINATGQIDAAATTCP